VRLPPPLLGLSPGDLRSGEQTRFLQRVDAAIEGGLRGVLLRERALEDAAFLSLARALRTRLDAVRGWLGVHDRAHLAGAAGADGLHLGFRSLPPEDVPPALRAGRALGLSTHAGDALDALPPLDYLFHGPVRATPSKQGLLDPIGTAGLARACASTELPIWAIGGLTPGDLPASRAAGARGVAVLRGILGASDPRAAARAYASAVADSLREAR
jgi:thiamine-phosphate pyrophosphorylase